MNTRRSWKNQERLWKYLTPPLPEKPVPDIPPPKTDEEIDAMWWMSARTKNMLKHDAAKQRKEKK